MSTTLDIVHPEFTPARDPAEERFLKPGGWWRRLEDGRIFCELCPRACKLRDGDRGFCFVRQNIGGEMFLTTYGRSTGFCIDPIEKKPLNHFYPGTSVLSFGTAGCNLGCKFCQNWDISKSREIEKLSAKATPEMIAEAADSLGCHSVAFTYNDPVIWAEYAIDTAKACRERGIKAVAVTAGYITPEARGEFYEAMDAANVDLKAFTEEFYHKITLSHLEPVLETLRWLKAETDVWFEITNLVIPDANDKPEEIRRMSEWILESVGDEVPVHFTAFHPDFRMMDRPHTPPETLNIAREIALETGLKYVYNGNVDDARRQSTYCGNCGRPVIERNWYELGRYALDGNRCRHCGHVIPGYFQDRAGTWGRRRLPVNISQFAGAEASEKDRETAGRIASIAGRASSTARGDPASRSAPSRPKQNGSTMQPSLLPPLELTDEHRERLLAVAAEIVAACARRRGTNIDEQALAGIGESHVNGVFVSLKRGGRLRSCCGSFGRPAPLAESLRAAALRTASDDPRLPRISASELPYLDMEVWLLHGLEPLAERGTDRIAAVEVGTHGLQVVRGDYRGLLLPGVAVEYGWNAEQFLNQTCLKAGLPATAWKDDETTVLRFRGEVFSRSPVWPGEGADEAPAKLSAREFAQYAQHCRQTIETLIDGGVPSYYLAGVSDVEVAGVAVLASPPEKPGELSLSRISWKGTVPLQSTLFSLCEQLAGLLRRNGARHGDYQIDLAVVDDAAMHGVLADADFRGADTAQRAVMVFQGNRSGLIWDRGRGADELVQQAAEAAGIADPQYAQILSLQVRSTCNPLFVVSRPRAVLGGDVRPPAVAGTFFPGDAAALAGMLDEWLGEDPPRGQFAACMVPHAGWRFSGRLAADVLKRIELPKTIIAIGPKHTPYGVEWAVAPHRRWSFPGGEVESDVSLAKRLAECVPGWELDAAAHRAEHGVEVELPIIHRLSPETKVVGVAIGGGGLERMEQFAAALAGVIHELPEPPLLLISSDMNHFADDAETRRLDGMALRELDRLDADALFHTCRNNNISMCGVLPAVIVLKTLARLGRLEKAQRVGYATSCDVTGESSRVVGYAGMLFA